MTQPVDSVSVEITYDTSQSLQRLRTAVDSALRAVVRDFDAAFDTIEREVSGAGAEIGREIERGGERAEGAIREVERQARSSFNRVGREAGQAGDAISRKLGGAMKALAGLAIGAGAVAGMGLLAKLGLSSAASFEQTRVAFSSLLGSVEEGSRVFADLQKFAATTPFELADITGAAQRFLAFNDAVGITDAQLQPFLTTLGNIASVTASGAEGVNRVTLALGQIASRGKVGLDDLQQISEALPGFSSVAAIAAARGQTTAQTLEDISAGSISATEGIAALLEGMGKFPGAAGAMEAQSLTLLGVFSTFKDTVSQALATAFEPVIPSLKQTMTEITPILGEALGQVAPLIGSTLTETIKALAPAIEPLATILATVMRALQPFIGIIGKILPPILDALVPVFEALEPVIVELAVPITDLVVALLPLLPVLAEVLVAVIAVAAPLLKLVGVIVSFLAQKAIVPLVSVLADVLGFLAEAVRQFGVWLTAVDWGAVLSAIGKFFTDLWDDVSGFFSDLFGWFNSLPGKTTEAFQELKRRAVEKVSELIAYVKTLPGKLVETIGNLRSKLIEKGKDVVRGLWDGISALGGWLWQKVSSFAYDNTVGAIKSILGIGSPSKVAAEEAGRWIPAGVMEGIESGIPQLRTMINTMVTPVGGEGESGGLGGGAGIVFGPGSVVLQFSGGALPSASQAQALGEAAGQGIVRALQRRNTQAAVRMV